ncbi:hypothetical protein Ahy_B06g086045 isoform E [Arachis hypogaea]|nr:hypothetical protein Ahy_B06g086045 isoform E [Arachis hypogaea]
MNNTLILDVNIFRVVEEIKPLTQVRAAGSAKKSGFSKLPISYSITLLLLFLPISGGGYSLSRRQPASSSALRLRRSHLVFFAV